MINPFRLLLLKIAQLSLHDQRWIMRRLSQEQQNRLSQEGGITLLNEAWRFRKLKPPPPSTPKPLPLYCEKLARKAPLYTAIVIDEGSYAWAPYFLQQYDADGRIRALLQNKVQQIKKPVKKALIQEWKSSLSFEAHLETEHG